jgi:superfamily II DNA/RNA helicase
MAGKDVVGMANTGTGKTAAFAIPFIQKAMMDNSQKLLVVAPTRELAVQIEQEIRQFTRRMNLGCAVCIGGVGMEGQIRGLAQKPNFVVGTPGRLKDLANQTKLNLGTFNNVVLDEVDRMLDMGFVHDVTNILTRVQARRQTAFFSATIPSGVERIIKNFSSNPEIIRVAPQTNVAKITQEIVKLNGTAKIDVLHNLLRQKGFDKVLVFGRSKFGLERLYRDLYKRGVVSAAIHGNKSQGARQKSLEMFKSNRIKVLLATDVASRGLDIDDITHVINYDLPESYEDYVHRIGRTGRANKSGIALTLV